MRRFVIIAFVLLAGCPTQRMPPRDHWHRLAAEADRMTSTFRGIAWEQDMLPVHNAFWAGIVASCGPGARTAGVPKFEAIAVINRDGVVADYLPNPDVPALQCFTKQMTGRKYPAPPESPFYARYTIDLNAGS